MTGREQRALCPDGAARSVRFAVAAVVALSGCTEPEAGGAGGASDPAPRSRPADVEARNDGPLRRDLRGLEPVVEALWLRDLGPRDERPPIAVHRGPLPTRDGIAVESNAAGYAVVRPDDGRVLRRQPHQPLAPRLSRPAPAVPSWPVVAGHRYATVPGAIAVHGGVARAVAVDGGVGPALVDVATGRRLARGTTGPRASVMSASWSPSGFLALGVRFSGGRLPVLRDDAVLGFAPGGTFAWVWPVPVPPVDRGDPIGLWATDSTVFVFYDGRFVAALATAAPIDPNADSPRLREAASPEKVKRISSP